MEQEKKRRIDKMLSGKLKNWVESHLNRKKSGRNKTGGGERNKHHDSIGSTMCNGADRIAHPASSLVSLTMPSVPTMMVCSSGGSAALGSGAMGSHSHGGGSVSGRRSNAALLIQLQKDIANSSSAACSATSSCYNTPSRSTAGGVHHPSWSRSPVMLAWNNSSAATTTTSSSSPVPRTPARPLLSSPFPLQHHPTPSPPPPLQYQQSVSVFFSFYFLLNPPFIIDYETRVKLDCIKDPNQKWWPSFAS